MPSRWIEYRTSNDDELDEQFFNKRFRSVDQRLTALEDTLISFSDEQTEFVRAAVASLNAAASVAAASFQESLNATLDVVETAEAEITALQAEVQALLGTLGTEFQVNCLIYSDPESVGSKVQIKRSAVQGAVPTAGQLDYGELAINYRDGLIFWKNFSNQVQTMELNASASAILAKLLTVDGTGSQLDADTLDGFQATAFSLAGHTHSQYLAKAGGQVDGTLDIITNSTGPTVRIRQTGIGDALVVEDETGDATPFRIDADGVTHTGSNLNVGGNVAATGSITAGGQAVYRVGGTDVSIADGGTGSSTAEGARTNLGLGNVDNTSDVAKPISTATQSALNSKANSSIQILTSGLATGGGNLSTDRTIHVPSATESEWLVGSVDNKALTPKIIHDSMASKPLTYAATVSVNLQDGFNFGGNGVFYMLATGNCTLGQPQNPKQGKSGIIWVRASGASRTVTLHASGYYLCKDVEVGPYVLAQSEDVGIVYWCPVTASGLSYVFVTGILRI